MTFAKDASIFVTGGDDCWLCMWNADTKKLVVRTRCKAPIRSISVHPNGQLLMVGMVGGGVALYACDTSNTAAKAVKSAGKSAGAFQRATEFIYEVTLTERAARRDCIEDISDVKFSPNGKMVAVASHDGFIDIYAVRFKLGDLQTPHSDFSLKYMKRLRGHSSFVVHLDWSEDNRLLQVSLNFSILEFWWCLVSCGVVH
jgi:microtubule-associated protein-like 1/2